MNIIKKFIDIYNDFISYRMIRQNLSILDGNENQELVRYIVTRYTEENEDSINALLANQLAKEMVKGNLSPEKYRGYLMALEHRIILFRNNRKLLKNKN